MATIAFTSIVFLTITCVPQLQAQRFVPFSLINTFPAYSTLPSCATSSIRSVLDPVAVCTAGNPSDYASCCCSNPDISASITNKLSTLFWGTDTTSKIGCALSFSITAIGLFNSYCSEMKELYPATNIATRTLTSQPIPTRSTCSCERTSSTPPLRTLTPVDTYWITSTTQFPTPSSLFTPTWNRYSTHTYNTDNLTSTNAPDPGDGGSNSGGSGHSISWSTIGGIIGAGCSVIGLGITIYRCCRKR